MLDIKYQVVLFGSYQDILPKPEVLKYFIDIFIKKELIPSTFQEIRPNGIENRFSFTNPDETWKIEFGSNRIDIFHTNKDIEVSKFHSLEGFIEECKDIVKAIEDKFPKKHNRLSLVTRLLLDEMSNEDHNKLYHKLNSTIPLYKENSIVDWDSRVVARSDYQFGHHKEKFNVISNIKRTKGNLVIKSEKKEVDRIELHFDINTFQGNIDYRFDSESFNLFINKAFEIENKLRTEYKKLIEQ